MNDEYLRNFDYPPVKVQESSDKWKLCWQNWVYFPLKGKEPNWFHRKMHELLLGVKWEKIQK